MPGNPFDNIAILSDIYDEDEGVQQLVDSGQLTTASNINRPEPTARVKEINLFNEFNIRNPKADGGRMHFDIGGISTKEFASKQNIYKTEGLRKLVGPASRNLPAYKIFTEALKNSGIKYSPSKGEGFPASFENATPENIKKFETEVSKLKAKANMKMSRVETENIKKEIKSFVKDKVKKGEYVSRPIIKEELLPNLSGKKADNLITRSLGIDEKANTGLLKKLGTEEKSKMLSKRFKDLAKKRLAKSDDILKDINNEFKLDPDISDSEELTRKIYGSDFDKLDTKGKLDLVTQTDNDVMKYLKMLRGSRPIPKGLRLPSQENIADIIDKIESGLEDEAEEGRTRGKKSFRFSEGVLRDYKFSLIDELLGLKPGTFRDERRQFMTKGNELDEIFGLSSSSKYAPGYAEAVQSISKKVNRLKQAQIDLPLSKILKAIDDGRTTMQYKGKKNVPILEVVKDFNKLSKAFAKKYNVRGPKINLGESFDLRNYSSFRPESQKNIEEVFKNKNYFLSEVSNKPYETITSKIKMPLADVKMGTVNQIGKRFAAIGCPGKAMGGRVQFDVGGSTQCIRRGLDKIRSGNLSPGDKANTRALMKNSPKALTGAAKVFASLGLGTEAVLGGFFAATDYASGANKQELISNLTYGLAGQDMEEQLKSQDPMYGKAQKLEDVYGGFLSSLTKEGVQKPSTRGGKLTTATDVEKAMQPFQRISPQVDTGQFFDLDMFERQKQADIDAQQRFLQEKEQRALERGFYDPNYNVFTDEVMAADGGLIGDKSGRPPESGPMSQGLPGILKRAMKLKE